MESFTYIISSINGTADSANNSFIELAGLPNYKKYHCEVIDFIIDIETIDTSTIIGSYASLVVDHGIQILNGVMHPRKFDRLCNFSLTNGIMTAIKGYTFIVENFNKHTANFQLILPNQTRIPTVVINQTVSTHWTLALKMTPII